MTAKLIKARIHIALVASEKTHGSFDKVLFQLV